MIVLFCLYFFTLLAATIFSYGFVDSNFPFIPSKTLFGLVQTKLAITTIIYTFFVGALFVLYLWFLWLVKTKKIKEKDMWRLIFMVVGVLIFSFPAFSNDIFNYVATAKVAFLYHENPYIVMPIEIPNEPMLAFTHAANKVALYGPIWILLTVLPHLLGANNIFLTIVMFKLFVLLFYLGLSWLIWQMSGKNLWSLTFFALNPLVVMETLISSHNDVVMMFFALFSFFLFKKNKIFLSFLSLILSILIKYATIFLLPIYVYLLVKKVKHEEIMWGKIWHWSTLSMFIIFLLSPIREEIYSWYLIWPLTFVALCRNNTFLQIMAISFSFGLPLRFAPFLYTRNWTDITPFIKKVVTFTPPIFAVLLYVLKKKPI